MARYYLDTSIWLDYYEKRGRNGKIAKKLIQKAIKNRDRVAFSDMHIIELKNLGYNVAAISKIVNVAAKAKLLTKISINKEQREEAIRIAKQRSVPRGDALHAILCRDSDCTFITLDEDFLRLRDVTESKTHQTLLKLKMPLKLLKCFLPSGMQLFISSSPF